MKVSVLLVTYNHQRYVAQAIESVLMQQTDFEYEILISEDCSTDSTREIVIGYQARYPDKIRLLLSDENLNDNSVVLRGIRAARGEYVAYLDGDDYWMSPQKLQKQVQFLDGHLECSMCFHECAILSGGTSDARPTRSSIKPFSSLNDLLEENVATACSVMFRLAALGNVPDWYTGCVFGDWPLYILLSQQGMIGYLPDCLAVYRIHSGGHWSGLPHGRRIEQLASFYARLRSHLGPRYDQLVRRITSSHYFLYARRSHLRGERAAAESLARLGLVENPHNWRLLLLFYAPAVYDGIAFLKHRIRSFAALLGRRVRTKILGSTNKTRAVAFAGDRILYLPKLEFGALDTCNMRCEHCASTSPLLSNANLPDLDLFVRTLANLSRVMRCGELKFVGGEPLLNRHLCDFMAAARRSRMFGQIRVTSNGLLLSSMSDEFWRLADVVEISLYPSARSRLTDDHLQELRAKASRFGAQLHVEAKTHFMKPYRDVHCDDAEEVQHTFSTCSQAHEWSCHLLYRDRFYRCGCPVGLDTYFREIGFEAQNLSADSVLIDERDTLFDHLRRCMESEVPLKACSFCHGTSGELTPHRELTVQEIHDTKAQALVQLRQNT